MTRAGLLVLAAFIGACAGARVDPPLSPEPRLEATIEALGDEMMRLRLERDSLIASSDSLRGESVRLGAELRAREDALASLRLELQRLKAIDLKPRRPKG